MQGNLESKFAAHGTEPLEHQVGQVGSKKIENKIKLAFLLKVNHFFMLALLEKASF